MISVLENKKCSGCTVCVSCCPVEAIDMVEDSQGFIYPQTDSAKCINCGKCNKVCPVENERRFNEQPIIYGMQLKDVNVLNMSQSGGAFWALAQYVLECGGVVYGAGYDENFRVVHKRADTITDSHEFHGSKYVQTDMRGIPNQVKNDVENERLVLFSGTACHISGLYRYLGKTYDNLFTCDFICHGVPSPFLLKKYIDYIKLKEKCNVQKFYFGYYNADMGYRWEDPRSEYIVLNNGKTYRDNKYMSMFLSNSFLRPYCHECPFTRIERIADFTMADYWGLSKNNILYDRKRGVSLLFVNSEAAKAIFTNIKDKVVFEQVHANDILKHQANLSGPSVPNKRRNLLFSKLIYKSFMSAYRTNKLYYNLYCLKQRLQKGRD